MGCFIQEICYLWSREMNECMKTVKLVFITFTRDSILIHFLPHMLPNFCTQSVIYLFSSLECHRRQRNFQSVKWKWWTVDLHITLHLKATGTLSTQNNSMCIADGWFSNMTISVNKCFVEIKGGFIQNIPKWCHWRWTNDVFYQLVHINFKKEF